MSEKKRVGVRVDEALANVSGGGFASWAQDRLSAWTGSSAPECPGAPSDTGHMGDWTVWGCRNWEDPDHAGYTPEPTPPAPAEPAPAPEPSPEPTFEE